MKGSKCKFCNSYKSGTRIVSKDGTYDEVACIKHIKELEKDADAFLGCGNGRIRMHITLSGIVCRGEDPRWNEFEEFKKSLEKK